MDYTLIVGFAEEITNQYLKGVSMSKKFIIVGFSVLLINIIVIIIALIQLNQSIQDAKYELSKLVRAEVKAESMRIEKEKLSKFKEVLFPLYSDLGLKYDKNPQTVIETVVPLLNVFTNIADSPPDEKNDESE